MTNQIIDRKSFILHTDSLAIIDELTTEQIAELFKAIYSYQKDGEIGEVSQLVKIAINPFINQFKRDSEKWLSQCHKSSEKGKLGNLKRWHIDLFNRVDKGELSLDSAVSIAKDRPPITPDRPRSPPIPKSLDSDNDNDNDSKSDSKKEVKSKKPKGFIPPTFEEIKKYCQERDNSVNPKKFFDYYSAGNWKDAKGNKVKNWKQKLLTWESKDSSTSEIQDPIAAKLNSIAKDSYFKSVEIGEKAVITCFPQMKTKAYKLSESVKSEIKAQFKQSIEIK